MTTERITAALTKAQAIVNLSEAEHRPMTDAERAEVKSITDDASIHEAIGALGKSVPANDADNGPYGLFKAAGWDVRSKPRVEVNGFKALGFERKAFMSAGENSDIAGAVGIEAYGKDSRYLSSALRTKDLGTATLVHELIQSARTLAAPEDMDLDYQGTATKPTSTVSVALSTFEPVWIATVSEALPLSLFQQPSVQGFVNDELTHAVRLGLDDHIVDNLTAGSNTITQGADFLLDTYRKALTDMREDGQTPSLFIIHPDDAEAFDMSRDGSDAYYGNGPFSSGPDTIWGVKRLETTAVTAGSPILVDVNGLGYVGLGRLAIDSDPYTGFDSNTVKVRVEQAAVVVLQRPLAVLEMTVTG